jgi:methylenetetrahydrofolate--tRNA-(uracil-5-)-methyltransferase
VNVDVRSELSQHDTISPESVTVIGGGLAGTEAAWQLAVRGVHVRLLEMRPEVTTPAHHTDGLAELVCSNSLKGTNPETAAGLLKRELESMGSIVLAAAHRNRVAAGGALAVDRTSFSASLTSLIESHPLVEIVRQEATVVPDGRVIIATGPLTSQSFESALSALVGSERLSFYDAAAPIIEVESIDQRVIFAASRYGKGEGADYLNAPMNEGEYLAFHAALIAGPRVHEKEFERRELFSACQPVEEVARAGLDALRFGALKPVGLTDPRTGERPWAVVQLRAENAEGTAYNLVGFQTNLTFLAQREVFRMIPGLAHAEFARYGVMHRNTFIDSPKLLDATLSLRSEPRVRIAGQLAGTEGYLEAAASGLFAAVNTYADIVGLEPAIIPATTAFGALVAYSTDSATHDYQPSHVNFGILPPLEQKVRGKRERYAAYSSRAGIDLTTWIEGRSDMRFEAAVEASRAV